jgi:hypothetical protein
MTPIHDVNATVIPVMNSKTWTEVEYMLYLTTFVPPLGHMTKFAIQYILLQKFLSFLPDARNCILLAVIVLGRKVLQGHPILASKEIVP